MMYYQGRNATSYKISDQSFAEGGEGSIHDIDGMPNYVAKIFKPEKRTVERERKISLLVSVKPLVIDQYAWPTDVLYKDRKFVGYIMPKVKGRTKLRNIYVYDNRKDKPWTLFIAIAKNLAAAVHNVHEINHVIGDLNPDNILVDPNNGMVTLVDIDSYHLTNSGRTYRCVVGAPEYCAPEIQGIHFPSAPLPTFTLETDRYALAVLVFALLMNGAHPFACTVISGSSSKFQVIDNIAKGMCPYFPETCLRNIVIPPYSPGINSLPESIQDLFRRAFVLGHRNPSARPSAEEWYTALETLELNIKSCSKHLYFRGAKECPWCEVERKMRSRGKTAVNYTIKAAFPSTINTANTNKSISTTTNMPSTYKYVPAYTTSSTKSSQSNSSTNSQTSSGPVAGKDLASKIPGSIGVLIMVVGTVVFFAIPSIRESLYVRESHMHGIQGWFRIQLVLLMLSAILSLFFIHNKKLAYAELVWFLALDLIQLYWTLADLMYKMSPNVSLVLEGIIGIMIYGIPYVIPYFFIMCIVTWVTKVNFS